MVGCATLTFARNRGVRQGAIAIAVEAPGAEPFINPISIINPISKLDRLTH